MNQPNGNQITPTVISNDGLNGRNIINSQNTSCRKISKRSKFSKDDDETLRQLVAKFGTKSWSKVASEFKGRNARQCRDRWNHYLTPEADLSEWTKEDDLLLISNYTAIGRHWTFLSECFPGRTSVNVRNRCVKLVKQLDKIHEDECIDLSIRHNSSSPYNNILNNYQTNQKIQNMVFPSSCTTPNSTFINNSNFDPNINVNPNSKQHSYPIYQNNYSQINVEQQIQLKSQNKNVNLPKINLVPSFKQEKFNINMQSDLNRFKEFQKKTLNQSKVILPPCNSIPFSHYHPNPDFFSNF